LAAAAKTEGEESVRSLLEDRVLAGERGAYRLVRIPDTVHAPTTVQAILAARVGECVAGRRVAWEVS
jgi:hypothetical protein